ncbi:methyltransferase domain-containing protein [Apiospora saccharicola]|uniref:Methyltransferase domain-containing protein n=1 Tax=Apiospora saccharicola TaxID=335842 RepID=A0ABR1UX22_9PEZI
MGAAALPLQPTGSLPPLRRPDTFTEEQVLSSLQNLEAIYCPIPLSLALQSPKKEKKSRLPVAPTPPIVDSGYASEDENDKGENAGLVKEALEELRSDVFERDFAIRWLTSFVSRVEEMELISEEARQLATDKAYCILESFTSSPDEEEQEDEGISRDFSFTLCSSPPSPVTGSCQNDISVRLTDGPLANADHTAVGLISFAASIIMSNLLCASPARFGIEALAQKEAPRIVELGAGTGLVGLVMAHMLPHLGVAQTVPLIATDFHPVVLENLRTNIAGNFPGVAEPPVVACHLDWSAPSREAPLDLPADMLVATDVVYAPEHAVWLRDCAAQLLAPDGVFWILNAVRITGKFEGISDTVETAFNASECPVDAEGRKLSILDIEALAKPEGLGRGDESGYKLYRIGWN